MKNPKYKQKNIERITKCCPENISSVVKVQQIHHYFRFLKLKNSNCIETQHNLIILSFLVNFFL